MPGSTLQLTYSNSISPSTTNAPLSVTSPASVLTLNSPVTVDVACARLSVGQFPLVKYTGSLGGGGFSALSSLTLPPHVYGYLSNNTANSSIDLVITNFDQPLSWNVGNGVWDIGQTANWIDPLGSTTTYQQVGALGDNVLFSDSAPGPSITVTLNTNVTPSSVTVSNANNTYTISGTGSIGGVGSFTKADSGTLTLSTTNSFAGGINLNGGTVIFSTLANLGGAGINFNGGTLQYNGNTDDISTRTVTFGSGGGTIDTAGSSVTFANRVGTGSVGGLTKTGSGTLTLGGTNTFSGNTVVGQGTLALAANTYLTNSAAIIVNSGAVLDTTISGVGLALSTPVQQILAGTGQINGAVTASPSTAITPATNGVVGTLSINGSLTVNGGTLDMDISSSSHDLISVSGNVTLNSGTVQLNVTGSLPFGTYPLISYTGGLSGAAANLTLSGFNQAGAIATLGSSSGEITLVVAVGASDNLTWQGNGSAWNLSGIQDWLNGATSWAYTNGDDVTFNDSGGAQSTVQVAGTIIPSMITVSNTAVPVYTLANNEGAITGGTNTTLVKEGTGTLIVATPASYQGMTTIQNGTLQIGDGSGSVGDIGTGNVTNNGALVFAQGDGAPHLVKGVISGPGSLTVNLGATGTTVELLNSNFYSGFTTISNGTLQVGNGTSLGSLGTALTVTNNGTLVLDKSNAMTFADNITGSGTFENVGSGTVSLTGSLTYLGNTYIENGLVKLGANNQLPNMDNVLGATNTLNVDAGLTSGGKLDMDGYNLTVNDLDGTTNVVGGVITNSSTTTTLTNILMVLNATNDTYNGQIMDHGTNGAKTELFVTGPGTLTLNPNTNSYYSGGTVVSNSTLALGTPNSDVLVNPNESLLAPGTGPITLLGTNAGLIVCGYTGSTTPTYPPGTNTIILPSAQTATIYTSQRGDVGSALQGAGTLNYVANYVRGGVSGNWSAFAGTITFVGSASGGNVGFGMTNGLPNATLVFNTNVDFHAGSLAGFGVNGNAGLGTWPTNASGAPLPFPIGALVGGGSTSELQGTSSGNAEGVNLVFEIGTLNSNCTYGGGIVDGLGLLKVGTGSLTLDSGGVFTTNVYTAADGFTTVTNVGYGGTNLVVYTGDTTISNGVLALVAPVNLTNSAVVTLASPNAVLDASAMGYITDLTYTLPDGASNEPVATSIYEAGTNVLAGIGTLNGFLQADLGSTFDVGLPTGVFNVTSNATLNGAVNMNIDVADSPNSSELVAPSFSIGGTATLVITNIGPALTNGVTFTLFNHGVTFASVTLPATNPTGTSNYMWQNNLSVNGSITLTNGGLPAVVVNPNPTNILYSVSSGNLTLSWPADHTGWTLQAQTNSLAIGISNDWVNVPNSSATNEVVMPINPANGTVFFRLVYTNTP